MKEMTIKMTMKTQLGLICNQSFLCGELIDYGQFSEFPEIYISIDTF